MDSNFNLFDSHEFGELKMFQSPEFGEMQTLVAETKVFFPAIRCAQILGYQNPRDAIFRHCKREGVVNHDVPTSGGIQTVKFITEGNLYRLIIRSKLPEAQRFESWVCDEILPSIRKQGFYIDPTRILDPDVIIQLANRVKELQRLLNISTEKNQFLSQQVVELQPKATYYDEILSCPEPIAVTLIAQDYGMSAVEFNKLLERLKVQHYLPLQKVWVLSKKYLGNGYTRILPLKIDKRLHKNHMYWTQKGRLFLYNLLKDHGIYPDIEKDSDDSEDDEQYPF